MKVLNVSLVSRKNSDKKSVSIIYSVSYRAKKKRISSGVKVKCGFFKKGSITIGGTSDVMGDNVQLRDGLQTISNIAKQCRNDNGSYNWDKFSCMVDETLSSKSSGKSNMTLLDYLEKYIRESKNKKATLQTYVSTLNHLKGFQSTYNTILTIDNTDVNMVNNFKTYLFKLAGLNNETTSKYIKNFKAFYRDLFNKGYVSDLRPINVTVSKRKIFRPTFTQEDLTKLTQVVLGGINENKYRDLLLILCFTGLRVSELRQLNSGTVDLNTGSFIYYSAKTNDPITKFIPETIRPLVKKYFIDNNINIVDQKFNKSIKEVCRKAGINQMTPCDKYKNNGIISESKPKYELVTTHIGRRTYCTTLAKSEISLSEITKLTGHKTVAMLEKYIHIETNDVIVQNTDYLNNLFVF